MLPSRVWLHLSPTRESAAILGATCFLAGGIGDPVGDASGMVGGLDSVEPGFVRDFSRLLHDCRCSYPTVRSWGSGPSTQIPFCLKMETDVILMEW